MATQNVNIGVNISDNGTANKTLKNVKDIHSELKATQQTAQSLNIPTPGGTPGSRAVYAKSAPTGSQQQMSGEEYGRARGSTGSTGASARDFANQAQGLGGLVRLYATYAANLFAVSAAFTALKNAADTSNLVKGMDQLGARSGVALGTLSKQLVEVTDGAISMREAMETVTKATSSGLSSKQVLELGNVAKKASQALGVGMEDAVSRLTRGITKLEPELLDELGIFTKIDPAVQKYAQSIGRAATSLTDFERRQAFAIAVLDEGNKKFGSLDLDANPYSKFLATLKNVGQTVLEVVNKAVIPLVDYLSKSPTALLTVLGGIATLIVRQALPAFGQLKAGLESAAESAQKKALARAEDAKAAQLSIAESVRRAADAKVEAQVEKVVAAESKINELKSTSIKKQSALYKILEKDLESITDKDLKRIDTSAKGLETRGLVDQAKAYRDTAQAVRDYQKEKGNYDIALKKEEEQLKKNLKWYSIEAITMETAEAAKRQAVRASIVSNAAYQASLVGVARAMVAVNAAIVEQGIVGWAAFTLRVKAGAAAIGGALATVGSAINKFLGVIGILTTLYSIFDSFLDGASEQVGKFDSAIDKAKSSADNLSKTYEAIYKNDPFSSQSVQARGNALMEVADGFKEVNKAAREAQDAIDKSWWAQLKEGIGLSGVGRNFGKSIATQLTSALKNIDDPAAKKALEDTVKNQLNITEVNFDNIVAGAKRVGASSIEIQKLQDTLLGLATQAKIAGVASAQFGESYTKITDQIAKINQKFAVTDDIALFAINSGNALNDLDNLLSQGITKSVDGLVTALEGIGKGTNIFGNMSGELIPLVEEAKSFKREFSEGSKQVKELGEQLDLLKNKKIDSSKFTESIDGQMVFDQEAFNAAVQELSRQRGETARSLTQAESRTSKAKVELEKVSLKVQETLPKALADSTNQLGIRLAGQLAKASTQVLQGAYASFDAIPELVAKSSQLKIQEIDAQIANTKALRELTTATVISSAQQKVTSAETSLSNAGDAGKEVAAANLKTAKAELSLLETAVKDPIQALKLLATEQENNTEIGKRLGGQVKDLAARTVEYTNSLKQLNQQKLSEQLQGEIEVNAARIKQEQNLLKVKQDAIKLDGDRLNLLAQQDSVGLDAKVQLNDQIALNRETQIDLVYQQKLLDIAKTYAEQAIRASVLPKADREVALQSAISTFTSSKDLANTQKLQDLDKSRLDLFKAQSAIVVERLNREENAYTITADYDKVNIDSALQLKQIKLETEQGVQAAMLQNISLTDTAKAIIEYQSNLKLAALERERAKVQANQEFERQATVNTFAIRKILAADTGEDGITQDSQQKIQRILDEEKVKKAGRDSAISQADALFNKTVAIATATKDASLQQEVFNRLIKDSTSFAETLKEVFGEVGVNLGSIATTLADVAKATSDRAIAEINLQKRLDSAKKDKDPEAIKDAEKALADQKKQNAKDELNDNIKVISSTKKVFKEKTGAYKVLDTMEKAMHTYKMVMMAEEIAMDLYKTGQSVINSILRMTQSGEEAVVSGATAVVEQGKGDPYTAFARMAAMAVFVGGILAKIGKGGGSSNAPFVPTSEQRQETQGTAMGYDSTGNKVQVRRGVFGDTEAKSESIANSLELISNNSVKGLEYDDKMLRSLQNLADALNTTAKGLYKITGLRAGSLSGVVEGTNTSGGLLGIGGLFSKSVSKSIVDSGLQLKGTFLDLVNGVEGTINTFETVSTTVKRSGFLGIGGGTSTSVNTAFKELNVVDPKAFTSLVNAFGYASDLLYEIADVAGKDAAVVTKAMSEIRVDQMASLRGLTGEAFATELSAVIGSVLDDTSLVIFAEFEKFANFGEGMLETVVRVIDSNKKVLQQLSNLSSASSIVLEVGMTSMQITENLVNIAGGLDKFLEQSNYFLENFFTEGERAIPVQKAVVKQLAALGYASVDTKAEFKALVQSLDLTDTNAQKTYQSLMDLAPGFIEVMDVIDSQSQALKDAATSFRDFIVQIREFKNSLLLGASSILTPAEKYVEAKAQFDTTYAQALAGDKVAMSNVTNSAQNFLEASKTYFASSEAYTTDFNTVLSKLDAASISAGASASVAELQLNALSIHTTLLTSINANIAAIAGVPQAASGGRVSGLTLVGEMGPELVDFSTPGRVYDADQTAGMFVAGPSNSGQQQLIQEVRNLRQEVARLRDQQSVETGHLINATYDAQTKNAEQVTEGVTDAAAKQAWANQVRQNALI
jgi:hypothetical protein